MNLTKKSNDKQDKTACKVIRNKYVPEQIADPHKFTRNTQSAFEKMIKNVANIRESRKLPNDYPTIIKSIYRGRFVCRKANCFHVTVSEDLVNRAIRFLDTLAKELENKKFKIQFTQDITGSFAVAIKNNEKISFHISEGYKYYPIKNEHRSELEKVLYRDRRPIPSGKLTLTILARETHISNSWSDGKKPIEDVLSTMISSFEKLVIRQKQRRVDNAVKIDRLREESNIIKEIESSKYVEKSVYEIAMQESQCFINYRNLDSYLNYVEAQYLKEYGCLNEASILWISTARKIAETQNPINKRLKLLNAPLNVSKNSN